MALANLEQVRWARYNLVEQIGLGNVTAVRGLGLPPPGPALDSLWQYVPQWPGMDEVYALLLEAGAHAALPNTGDCQQDGWMATMDYPEEGRDTLGNMAWFELLDSSRDRTEYNARDMKELRNLPTQALQILYDSDLNLSPRQRTQIRQAGGGNYQGYPFTSARWSTMWRDYDSDGDPVDTASESDYDDGYIPPELRGENPADAQPRAPAMYRDRVDALPSYDDVLEWDAAH